MHFFVSENGFPGRETGFFFRKVHFPVGNCVFSFQKMRFPCGNRAFCFQKCVFRSEIAFRRSADAGQGDEIGADGAGFLQQAEGAALPQRPAVGPQGEEASFHFGVVPLGAQGEQAPFQPFGLVGPSLLAAVVELVQAEAGVGVAQQLADVGARLAEVFDEQFAYFQADVHLGVGVGPAPDGAAVLAVDGHRALHVVDASVGGVEHVDGVVVGAHLREPVGQAAEEAAAEQGGDVRDVVAPGQVADVRVRLLVSVAQALGAVVGVVVDDAVEAGREVGMRVQEVGLALQLRFVRPEVVALADGDVGAAAQVVGGHEVADEAQVLLAVHEHDAFRVAQFPRLAPFGRAVGAGVVADDQFEVEVRLLQHDAADGLVDIVFLIVRQHQDADFGAVFHTIFFFLNRYWMLS